MQRRDHVDARAVALLVLLCATWGLQQVAVKVAVTGGLPPVLQAGIRSLVAGALVCGWIGLRQGSAALFALFRRDAALRPGLIIALLFACEFLLLFPGLQLTTASRGVLFLYTAPFFTALGAHLFLPAERLRPRQALGLLVAFLGVAIAFAGGLGQGGSLRGDLLCLGGAVMWGATTVVVKANPSLARTSPARVLLLQLLGSAPVLLLASWLLGEMHAWPQATALAWGGLFYQTAIVAFASYLAWFWLVLVYPATRIAGFTFLTPLFGILAGAVLLHEHASLALLAGVVAIAIGLRLVNSRAVPQIPALANRRTLP
jgi:drug/metabolite transporter (DMT)-like permease